MNRQLVSVGSWLILGLLLSSIQKTRGHYPDCSSSSLGNPQTRTSATTAPCNVKLGYTIPRGGSDGSSRNSNGKKPWEKISFDPNPFPSIEELEESTTMEELDSVLDQLTGTQGGCIIHRYRPERSWLWKQFYSTVLYHSWKNALLHMAITALFCSWMRHVTSSSEDWNILKTFQQGVIMSHRLVQHLAVLDKIWKNMMSLTTFLLTFFVGQAYGLWRQIYDAGRGIQGRMNDINLLLATYAARDGRGMYTTPARAFLEDVAAKLRLFHLFLWASNARRFRVVLTDRGLDRMVERGILPHIDRTTLDRLDLARTQYHVYFLESVVIAIGAAMNQPNILPIHSHALEHLLLEKICVLRGTYGTVSDLVDGRMPLAYAHFVQILVDSFLFVAPLAQ